MSELVAESPVPEEAAPVEAAPPILEDTAAEPGAVERDVESDTLEIPDSSQPDGKAKYVPAAALAGVRRELKDAKAALQQAKEGSAKATQLEQTVAHLQQQVEQLTPYVQAYQAAVAQPQTAVEDDSEARELAVTLDLYKPDGTPDVDKAKKTLALMDKRARTHAEQSIAPLQQRSIAQQSHYNLQRALNTDINGVKPDPAITRALWARLDPSVTANEEQAKHLVIQALGMTVMQGKAAATAPTTTQRTATGQFAKAEDIPPPLHVEKAGGKDTPNDSPLSAAEKAYIADMKKSDPNYSEKQYLETSRGAAWLRR